MQDNCNLVLYEYNSPVWATNTHATGRNGCRAVMQSNGNFVISDSNGGRVWSSNSGKWILTGHYVLVLREDGNVLIYGSDVWPTGTYRRGVGGGVVTAMNGTVDAGLEKENVTAVGGLGGVGEVAAAA